MKYILLLSIGLLFSCGSGSNTDHSVDISIDTGMLDNSNHSVDISMDTWILDNQELKSILSDYIRALDEESVRENSFIEMHYRIINDSTCLYHLSESADICSFIYGYYPPHILFQVEKKLVCFHIEEYGTDIFRMNDKFLVAFMKKNYPDQYNYYLKVGEYPPPITGGGLEWDLIFQNDRLISKEVEYTQ